MVRKKIEKLDKQMIFEYLFVFLLFIKKGYTSVSTAIVADVFPPETRASKIGIIMLPSFMGSLLLPPITGFLVDIFGWRACFWVIIIPAFFAIFILYFLLPETVDLSTPKRPMNPISTIRILTKFPLSGVIFCNAFTFAAMIMTGANFSVIIADYYTFGAGIIGLLYVSFGVGSISGAIIGGKIADIARNKKGIGGLISIQVFFSLITASMVVFYGWIIPYSPIGTVIAVVILTFGGVTCRAAIFSFGVQLNQDRAAQATASLVFFQYSIAVFELFITGLLLPIIVPGYIFSMWAALIVIFMPISIYVIVKFWGVFDVKKEEDILLFQEGL